MASQAQIPKDMKAAQFKSYGAPYEIVSIPVPSLDGPYDILIKTGSAGFCHTDLMCVNGEFNSPLPLTGSHEPAGTVVDLGEKAKGELGFKVGDRIGALNFYHPCGSCPDCKHGRVIYCDNLGMVGINKNGAFAEYVVVDSRFSVHLPDNMAFEEAAPLMCAGATIYNSIKACDLKQGEILGIVGLGALGHIGVQLGKAMGYRVVGIDSRSEPLGLAKGLKLAPDLLLSFDEGHDSATKKISELDPSKDYPGVDAVVIATDNLPSFEYGTKILRKHGTLVIVGQPKDPIPIRYFDAIFRDINFKGSLLADRETTQELVELISKHGIEIKLRSYKLEEISKMIDDNEKPEKKGKFVISFAK